MAERKYQGAGIGIARMNKIMQLLLFRPMNAAEICDEMNLSLHMTKNYMARLEDSYKVSATRPETGKQGGKPKVYTLVFGAMPLPQVHPKKPPSRPPVKVKSKTGPKPKPKQERTTAYENRIVKVSPAQQLGMPRDPMVAMLFGTTQRQGA